MCNCSWTDTLDDKGEKREDVTSDEYGKVQGFLDQQDELVKMIKTEERMEKSREELREPVEEPVTKNTPPDNLQYLHFLSNDLSMLCKLAVVSAEAIVV